MCAFSFLPGLLAKRKMASETVTVRLHRKTRLLRGAACLSEPAASAEMAARGTGDRHLSGQNLLRSLSLGINFGVCGQKRMRVRVARPPEHLAGGANLDDPAEIHNGNCVGYG